MLFDGADWDQSNVRRFHAWLARSADHRPAFEAVAKTWNKLDLLATLESRGALEGNAAIDRAGPSRRSLIAGVGIGAAATLGAGAYLIWAKPASPAYQTGTGEQRDITLSDGTTIAMNAQTQFSVRSTASLQEVSLSAGEALFTIAANTARRFIIRTRFGELDADNSKVLVKVLAQGARITLISGTARATQRQFLSTGTEIEAGPETELVIGPQTLSLAAISAPVVERRTLWREGMLAFDGEPLEEATNDVSRQTGVSFRFADPALAELRVGGLVRANDVEAFRVLLRDNLAIQSERQEDGAILLSSTATF